MFLLVWLALVGAAFAALLQLSGFLLRATPARAVAGAAPRVVLLHFASGDPTMPSSAARDLGHALRRSEVASPIWVFGYARERDDLAGNLDLAESRANAVARYLMNLGTVSDRIHVAAGEALADDRDSSRVEVRLVERAVER